MPQSAVPGIPGELSGRPLRRIGQQIHFRLQEAAAVLTAIDELLDLEAIDALSEDIAAAIGVAAQHTHHLRGAADNSEAIALRTHDAEGCVAGDAFGDHLAITRLEDVERQRHSGKSTRSRGNSGIFMLANVSPE